MSEGNIRINKVLRELNISLERAVDYLKDKGIAIEASPNTKISDDVYNILCGQFAGDKGNKEASKGISEEIRKEKEALRLEREKEIEDKRKQEEERQRLELIKAKAVISGPKQVGKIDLDSKATAAPTEAPKISAEKSEPVVAKSEAPAPVVEPIKEVVKEAESKATDTATDETITTQYQKLSGATLTGQVIDLSQFDKPKKKNRLLLTDKMPMRVRMPIKINAKELLRSRVTNRPLPEAIMHKVALLNLVINLASKKETVRRLFKKLSRQKKKLKTKSKKR
jgi:translation initiation factor IF-2